MCLQFDFVTFDPDAPPFQDAFLIEHKKDYIKKEGKFKDRASYSEQGSSDCTICLIISEDKDVPRYEIYRTPEFIVFLNLFPYTSGHILISPIQHLVGFEEFTDQLSEKFAKESKFLIKLLKTAMKTDSVNFGWNQGQFAGGSIKHFHAHLVPRYPRELNFIELIGRSRPMILSLEKTQELLITTFKELRHS